MNNKRSSGNTAIIVSRLCIFSWSPVIFFRDILPVIPDLRRICSYTMIYSTIWTYNFSKTTLSSISILKKTPHQGFKPGTSSLTRLTLGATSTIASSVTHKLYKDNTYLNSSYLKITPI